MYSLKNSMQRFRYKMWGLIAPMNMQNIKFINIKHTNWMIGYSGIIIGMTTKTNRLNKNDG